MKKKLDSQELIKYLKKGELIRNDIKKEDVKFEIFVNRQQKLEI